LLTSAMCSPRGSTLNHEPLPADVTGAIALDEEMVGLTELTAADSAVCWDRVLFCAKETVYKAWFPLTHRWLGFEQASVIIDPPMLGHADGTFSAHLLVTGPVIAGKQLIRFVGRWLISNGLVITTIACGQP
jgi:enterobactin synthetase component D / holo-[acyl-carrier protein] synthase